MDLLQSALMAVSISFGYCGADARDVQHEFSMQFWVVMVSSRNSKYLVNLTLMQMVHDQTSAEHRTFSS